MVAVNAQSRKKKVVIEAVAKGQPLHVITAENKATVAVNAKSRKKKGVIEAEAEAVAKGQPLHVIIAENKATVAVNAKSRKKKGVIEAVETMKAVEEDEDVAEEILTMIETKDIKIQGVVEVIVEF
jgi:hypothetical protein